MSTDTRPAWAPTGPFPQRVKLRNGWTATLNGTNAIGFLVGRIRDSGPDCKWHKNGWCTLRTFSTDQRQFDIIGPAGEEQDIAEMKEELERLRAENERLKLLAAPEPPPGEWQETHRVIAVRPAKNGEVYISLTGRLWCASGDHEEWSMRYILEPLESPKPAFVCPPHLVGLGILSCDVTGRLVYWFTQDFQESRIVSRDGKITAIGRAMGFTSLPNLHPGQEMRL